MRLSPFGDFAKTSGFSSACIPVALLCLRRDWEIVCTVTVVLVLYTGGAWAGRDLPDHVYQSLLRQRERFKISKKGLKPRHPLAGSYVTWMPVLCLSTLHGRELGCTKTSQCLEEAGVWPCSACAKMNQCFWADSAHCPSILANYCDASPKLWQQELY